MIALAIVAGSLIVWATVSSRAAVLGGRVMRLADRRIPKSPPTGRPGTASRGHLRAL